MPISTVNNISPPFVFFNLRVCMHDGARNQKEERGVKKKARFITSKKITPITKTIYSSLPFLPLFLIKKDIYMLIGSLFLESPSALVKFSSSEAFNPQLETSLLIAVKRL